MSKCQVCSVIDHKYKCPRCVIKYCSMACYKTHKCKSKSTDALRPLELVDRVRHGHPEAAAAVDDHDVVSEDRIPIKRLELLRCDSQLMECLKNPHLRAIVSALDVTTEPDKDIFTAMKEPLFAEFVDNCLRVVESCADMVKRDGSG